MLEYFASQANIHSIFFSQKLEKSWKFLNPANWLDDENFRNFFIARKSLVGGKIRMFKTYKEFFGRGPKRSWQSFFGVDVETADYYWGRYFQDNKRAPPNVENWYIFSGLFLSFICISRMMLLLWFGILVESPTNWWSGWFSTISVSLVWWGWLGWSILLQKEGFWWILGPVGYRQYRMWDFSINKLWNTKSVLFWLQRISYSQVYHNHFNRYSFAHNCRRPISWTRKWCDSYIEKQDSRWIYWNRLYSGRFWIWWIVLGCKDSKWTNGCAL